MIVTTLTPTIKELIANLEPDEVEFILANYKEYLKLDLSREFVEQREINLKESPLSDILKDSI